MNDLINYLSSEGSNFFNTAHEFIQNLPKHRTEQKDKPHLFRKSSSIERRWKYEHYATITPFPKKSGFSQNGSITSTRILSNAITMQAVSNGNKLIIG